MKHKKMDKDILVKRIFLDKKEYSYIMISQEDYDGVLEDQIRKAKLGIFNDMIIERANYWQVIKRKIPQIFKIGLFK